MTGTPQQQEAERVPLDYRIVSTIEGWGDRLSGFGSWLNNPPDMPGVWSRIGVLTGIFMLAVTATVTFCIVMYWISSAVQYSQCVKTALDPALCRFFAG
mgnify:CR=1 FL=1